MVNSKQLNEVIIFNHVLCQKQSKGSLAQTVKSTSFPDLPHLIHFLSGLKELMWLKKLFYFSSFIHLFIVVLENYFITDMIYDITNSTAYAFRP